MDALIVSLFTAGCTHVLRLSTGGEPDVSLTEKRSAARLIAQRFSYYTPW